VKKKLKKEKHEKHAKKRKHAETENGTKEKQVYVILGCFDIALLALPVQQHLCRQSGLLPAVVFVLVICIRFWYNIC